MELFSLLAKLTLDTKEYESSLKSAENLGKNTDNVEASLDLDTTQFDQAVAEANDTTIDNPESPELDLDDDPFQKTVEDAEEEKVDNPDEPELGLDNTPFKESLGEAESEAGLFEGSIGTILDNIKGLIAGAGIAASISTVVSGLSEAVDLARSMGDSIDKSSRAMSISTDAYQEWGYILEINGASITDLNRGLMNLRKLTQGGEVSKEATEAFEKLGISAQKADGSLKSTEEILDETLRALADYNGEDRDILAQAIFGRGGTKLNALFDGTSQDIDYLKKQAHDLGLVMSEDAVANAAAYNDAVTNMQKSIEAFKVSIAEQLLPLLTDITNRVAAIIAFFNPRTWDQSLSDQFRNIDDELADNLLDIEATSGAAMTMIDKLFSMGDATKLNAEQQAQWKATAEWLIEKIPSLSEVINTDTLEITANKDEVIALTKEWKNYAIERAKADALKEKQEALAKKTTKWLEEEAKVAKQDAEAEKKRQQVLQQAREDLEKAPEDIRQKFVTELGYSDLDSLFADREGAQKAVEKWTDQYGPGKLFASRDFWSAYGEWQDAAKEAEIGREHADQLKQEVEAGQVELAEYSATLDTVIAGLESTGDEAEGTEKKIQGYRKELEKLPKTVRTTIEADLYYLQNNKLPMFKQAKGNWDVPYDEYPSLLHRGEMVLTASEARDYRDGSGGGIDYTELENRLIAAIRNGMDGATVRSYLNGRDITDEVNRNNMRDVKGRRFAT